jgi:membrane peptidoglycan carboxypeptidase
MPYRPTNGRHLSPNPYRDQPRGSYAARLAVSRTLKRRSPSRGPNTFLAVGLVLVVTAVTLASATAIAVGGAAGVTIASLEKGLPDVRAFQDLGFAQPSRIFDRTGKVELARFWEERRQVVKYEDIPKLVLDVTTAVEDATFWDNPGFDLPATLNAFAQDVAGSGERGGASTITQQLVRARLLPEDVIAADNTQEGLYLRKAKELIQAFKLTQAYPGEEGKKAIITAYLNEIFYGQNAYGIAAAADVYLGKKLKDLSVSEAALLAGIPQRPSDWDPYKYAVRERVGKTKKGKPKHRLVVPSTLGRFNAKGKWVYCEKGSKQVCAPSPPVVRRNFILRRLAEGKGRWTSLTQEQLADALDDAIVLKRPRKHHYKAPHFIDALQSELSAILADREPLKRGGYRVITTLDMRAQRIGEKFVKAGAMLPNMSGSAYYQAVRKLGLRRDSGWISRLRGANIRNGAMAAMDYRTGDILAYVGSAGYYRKGSSKFQPKYDHVGQGRRQPGSAWKPIVYATGIDTGRLTAGSVVLDITTAFGPGGWTPKDADRMERGPMLVRKALQYSLNIPAIRALHRVGIKAVRKYANRAGFTFINGPRHLDQAGLAGAIGTVEVRLIDMVATFGAFGNGGKVTRPRHILRVEDSEGKLIYKAGDPVTAQVWSPQAAYIMANILAGNTNPSENLVWGKRFPLTNGPGGRYRQAALKTGTTNDLRDYSTYGFLPIPKQKKLPAVSAGFWFGNSDHSSPRLTYPLIYSMDNAGEAWHAFMRDYMKGKPTATFKKPKGVVEVTIDKYTGGAPGPWTRGTTRELFVQGTQPGGKRQVDPPGLLYGGCSGLVQPLRAENPGAPAHWVAAVNAWASRGVGSVGRYGTVKTTFGLAGITSFGGTTAAGTSCSGASTDTSSSSSSSSSSSGGSSSGGSSGGGSTKPKPKPKPKPAPTCRPGSTTKPPGCTIPAP